MDRDPLDRAAALSCWTGPVAPEPIPGGLTNANFVVESEGRRYFVRIGHDIPMHGVMRFNELAASRAAHAAGISPEVLHHEDGAIVLRFVDGRTLAPTDIQDPAILARVIPLIQRCHRDIPAYLHGPTLVFWVFQVVRDYASTLQQSDSRFIPDLAWFLEAAGELEAAVGPITMAFGHNDLLASNFIDDGSRLWLVDWDYAGFNSPLFDLAGLASNNELAAPQQEQLLTGYFGGEVTHALRYRYAAMKCASLLRESMWSMVSECHSVLEIDYVGYTDLNLARFEAAWAEFDHG